MNHEHRLRVRYGETDQMGVVHHANYVLYVEEARTAYMSQLGCPYREVERSGVGLAVRRADLRYRSPAFFEDELVVETRLTRLGAASVTFAYEIHRPRDGRHIASAMTELACIELTSPKRPPRKLPDDLRALLERVEP